MVFIVIKVDFGVESYKKKSNIWIIVVVELLSKCRNLRRYII